MLFFRRNFKQGIHTQGRLLWEESPSPIAPLPSFFSKGLVANQMTTYSFIFFFPVDDENVNTLEGKKENLN